MTMEALNDFIGMPGSRVFNALDTGLRRHDDTVDKGEQS